MTGTLAGGRRLTAIVATLSAALALMLALGAALPAAASAHAALLRTAPQASVTLGAPPGEVALTFSEAVEPRFAIVSVTDASGNQEATSAPHRVPGNPDTLAVPVRSGLAEGWYLVFWRAISADGHPVRGAFTFAVGPNPGPAPQFVIPSLSETAATPQLLIARWLMFVAIMAAVGLLAFRLLLARPLHRAVPEVPLRPLNRSLAVAFVLALAIVPVYVDLSTAQFSLRGALDLGSLVPLYGASAFGRSYLDLELTLALLAFAALVAVWLDRPQRPRRSVAELLASLGALLATGALLLMPGLGGHAAQKSPRAVSVAFDAIHLAAGSIWLGGLIGLLVVAATVAGRERLRALSWVVPRFSNVALASVLTIVASGTVIAFTRLPTLSSLFHTGYGQALLLKIGFLTAAVLLGAVNLLRTVPRMKAARPRPAPAEAAAGSLGRLLGGEVALVVGALFAAGLLSSLAPPSSALGRVGSAAASVGPGPVTRTVTHGDYRLAVQISPNKAAVPNAFALSLTRGGQPVTGARVTGTFDMLDMEMQQQEYDLAPSRTQPGVYARSAPSLVMVGHWGLTFTITPPGASPFDVVILDRADG